MKTHVDGGYNNAPDPADLEERGEPKVWRVVGAADPDPLEMVFADWDEADRFRRGWARLAPEYGPWTVEQVYPLKETR